MRASSSAWQMFPLSACEPRVKVSVATALPTEVPLYDPVSPWNYAAGIFQPFLIQAGLQDEASPKKGSEQLLQLIASPMKQLLWYDGDHSLPVAYVPDAVAWFRTHLQK
ncbi:MAG: hypothetical protein HOC74_03175 [Gemmatimonadetes bacterium]|jgi:fermentation-respiration switch protein FrsA (DUF1100 family)|nr:hypothetical protein [Gemmatimonadota bacterium]